MIELRTSNYSRIDEIVGLIEDADKDIRIGLGSEGCVHKLPSIEDIMRVSDLDCGVTLVTPITPQKHFDRVCVYIREVTEEVADRGIRNFRIVVNDLGILYSCDIDRPVAGRGIVHTSEACPWVDHLLRSESDYVRDAYLQTNLNYSRTYALLRKMGVVGIETDMLPRTIAAAKRLGTPVYAHFGYAVVAYARSCHTARFHQKTPPACVNLCNSPMELVLREIFDPESLGFAPPDDEVREVFPTLYLLGNTIYMRSDFCDASGVNGVIVNLDICERMGDLSAVSLLTL